MPTGNKYLRRYSPKHRVFIQRRKNSFVAEDVTDDVVGVMTTKKLGAVAGGFTLNLVYRKRFTKTPEDTEKLRYDKLVEPDDIVTIELNAGDGTGFIPVMVGMVDRSARTNFMSPDGKPVRSVTISGMEMGKILSRHDCGWDLAVLTNAQGDELAIRNNMARWQLTGDPTINMTDVMNNLFYKEIGDWAKNLIFQDFRSDDDWIVYNKTIDQKSGSVWAALKTLANEPYNMLYTLTKPDGLFYIVHRKQPFMSGEKAKLDPDAVSFYEVSEDEIVKEDLGVSDTDRINYASFENYLSLFGADDIAYLFHKYTQYDTEDVKAHGFRPFRPQTSYVPLGKTEEVESGKSSTQRVIEERTNLLWDWFSKNHEYENGNIMIHGNPRILVGEGLVIKETNMEYYIENITHKFSFGREKTNFTTTVGLTRGQDHGA